MGSLFAPFSVSELEARLVSLEAEISERRAEQVTIVNELRKINAHRSDASRTLGEWVQSHLDVSKTTAAGLVTAARSGAECRRIERRLGYDGATFDRVVEMYRYVEAGATETEALETGRLNLEDLRRMRVRRRRMTAADERKEHTGRFLSIQPSLDEGAWTIHGRLPGLMGRVVDKAITQKADELRLVSGAEQSSRRQRQADALVALMQDSLDRDTTRVDGARIDGARIDGALAGHVTVFVDARTNTVESCGGYTAEVAYGPRVGPETLEALLCGGTVRVVGLDTQGNPVATSRSARAIPKATRDSVVFRDGGCTIDGCQSRYRLEPHHIIPRSHGGNHEPDNLTTLCWYHHHIAIHTNGYRIDEDSPPGRRRLINQKPRRAPPLSDW